MSKAGKHKKKDKLSGVIKALLWIVGLLSVVLIGMVIVALLSGNGQTEDPKNETLSQTETKPNWGKAPEDFSLSEYEALSPEDKDAFFESFETPEAFESWLISVGGVMVPETTVVTLPWGDDEKSPEDYTWEEFLALSEVQKDAFYESFDSPEDYEAWMDANRPTEPQVTEPPETVPQVFEKPLTEYTWEEFLAMSEEEQDSFFRQFESTEAFEAWMNAVKPAETEPAQPPVETTEPENPWESGEKDAQEYTWEEFLALSPEEQEQFFLSFETSEEFEAWMNRVNPEG